MDDLKQQCTSLQQQLAALEGEYDQQKRLMTKTLRMLVGTLETEYPGAIKGKSGSALGESIAELQHSVGDIERTYRAFTMERESLSTHLKESLESWIRQIRQQSPGSESDALDVLEGQLGEACENFASLTTLLTSLLDLQRRLMLNEDGSVKAAIATVQTLPVEALVTLKRLLDLLPLDEKGKQKAHSISDGFRDQMQAEELVDRLHDIVALLEERNDDKVDEVADFLKSLAKQLAELQHELQASREENEEFNRRDDHHTAQMSKGFEDIQEGLNRAGTFEELKSVVAEQLEHLVESFNEFKVSRHERLQAMEERYNKVVKHLAAVEGDASSAHKAIDLERKKALTDHLTQLPNRRAYEEHVRAELHRWQRYATPFSVLVIDIDYFKKINDLLGHLIGDRALKLVAKVLSKQLRESDMIARYGGEEFVVLLANADLDAAKLTGEKLRRAIEKAPFKYSGKFVDIRVSLGVTEVREKDTISSIFERADKALYRAKQAGRNRVEVG